MLYSELTVSVLLHNNDRPWLQVCHW